MFTELCKSVLDLNINIVKAFKLGQKLYTESNTTTKPHSLLIKVNDEETHREVLACAPKLRFSTTWNQVYIQPDMSPKEREAHKKVYEELKRQRNQGENNLVIRNGKIVSYISRSYRTHVITSPSTTSNTSIPMSKPVITGDTESSTPNSEIAMESNAPSDNVTSAHS